jgi:hypothetical protein
MHDQLDEETGRSRVEIRPVYYRFPISYGRDGEYIFAEAIADIV